MRFYDNWRLISLCTIPYLGIISNNALYSKSTCILGLPFSVESMIPGSKTTAQFLVSRASEVPGEKLALGRVTPNSRAYRVMRPDVMSKVVSRYSSPNIF